MFGSLGKKLSAAINPGAYIGTTDEFKSLIPGIGDAMAVDKANEQNIKYANQQMQFQERMANTAYQRAMDDMKKAGLNPMLAFSQGGASVPTGAAPTINPATKTRLGEMAINSALQARGQNIQAQQADTSKMQADSAVAVNNANAAKIVADTQKTQVETNILKRKEPAAKLEESLAKKATNVISGFINQMESSAKDSKKLREAQDLIRTPKQKPQGKPLIKNRLTEWLQNK